MNKSELQVLLDQTVVDFSKDADLTPELLQTRRSRIMKLQHAMEQLPAAVGPDEYNEGNITHHFATGVYGRELHIKKGSLIVSKIHKAKTFNIIAKGTIAVICPNHGYNVYEAPTCFVSNPLSKRVVVAIEDTLWITAHGTYKTNLDEVEEEIISKDFTDEEQE